MRRNAVVSVFLRVLEYYSGILFLTTNKVGHFDEAFKSRIHVSLYYPQLDQGTSGKIWKMNLRRLVENRQHIEVDSKAIRNYAKKHYLRLAKAKRGPWNGRQIKNAFQTAIALAEFDARVEGLARPVLSVDHFHIVAKASEGFDEYLSRIHGTDMDRARREGQRDDEQSQPVVFPVPRKSTSKYKSSSDSSSSSSESTDEPRKKSKRESAKKKATFKSKHKGKAREFSSNKSTSSSSSSEEFKLKEKRKSKKEELLRRKEKEKNKSRSKSEANGHDETDNHTTATE